MEVIRTSLRFSTTNRFDQRTIRENTRQGGRWLHPVCGGAVLSIDLHKAFDMVSREQLANTLAALPGPDEAKAAALRLHTECTYHLSVAGQGAAVHTTRGVRQGCRLAPALWSAVTGDLLRRMTEDPQERPLHSLRRRSPGFVNFPHPGRPAPYGQRGHRSPYGLD